MPAPPGWKRTPTLPHVALKLSKIVPTKARDDLHCRMCGARMRLIDGPYGRFYGCHRWPKCVTIIKSEYDGTPIMQPQDRPPLKQAILLVMGDDTCNAGEILRRLSQKGWNPTNAKDPEQYIGYMLSSSRDVFKRVPPRGYRNARPTWHDRILEDDF